MTTYESNTDVEPVRVATYRHLRKAFRRGWAIPVEPESSLADLAGDRTPPRTLDRGRT
jgi:hypothetical protein